MLNTIRTQHTKLDRNELPCVWYMCFWIQDAPVRWAASDFVTGRAVPGRTRDDTDRGAVGRSGPRWVARFTALKWLLESVNLQAGAAAFRERTDRKTRTSLEVKREKGERPTRTTKRKRVYS